MSCLVRNIIHQNKNLTRFFSREVVKYKKSTPTIATPIEDNPKFAPIQHKVNNLERRILVWTGKYKSLSDVPAVVA